MTTVLEDKVRSRAKGSLLLFFPELGPQAGQNWVEKLLVFICNS